MENKLFETNKKITTLELFRLVSLQLKQNTSKDVIIKNLKEYGFSEYESIPIIDAVEARMKKANSYRIQMFVSGGICLLGIIATSLTYNNASNNGGSYTICYGAIIIGGINFIISLVNWSRLK